VRPVLVVVGRVVGGRALAGLPRAGSVAVLAAVLGGAAGLAVSRALGSDPVPTGGVLAAIGIGVLAGVVVLVVAGAVMMGLARRPLLAAVAGLRRPDDGTAATAEPTDEPTAGPTTAEEAR
jgi:putative peptidoglycan lipid II flippase